jgi:hypothetical protein
VRMSARPCAVSHWQALHPTEQWQPVTCLHTHAAFSCFGLILYPPSRL